MEQYKQDATTTSTEKREAPKTDTVLERRIHSLEQRLSEQADLIQSLTKELKRCKLKIDEHSNHINKIKLNG